MISIDVQGERYCTLRISFLTWQVLQLQQEVYWLLIFISTTLCTVSSGQRHAEWEREKKWQKKEAIIFIVVIFSFCWNPEREQKRKKATMKEKKSKREREKTASEQERHK